MTFVTELMTYVYANSHAHLITRVRRNWYLLLLRKMSENSKQSIILYTSFSEVCIPEVDMIDV